MDSFLPILIYLKLEVWYNLGTLLKSWSEHHDISSLKAFQNEKDYYKSNVWSKEFITHCE